MDEVKLRKNLRIHRCSLWGKFLSCLHPAVPRPHFLYIIRIGKLKKERKKERKKEKEKERKRGVQK
jgi:hypothetical protein